MPNETQTTQAKPANGNAQNANAPAQAQTTPLSVTPAMFPEMPYSANVRATDADGFEWQFTVRGVNEKPFMERVVMLKQKLIAAQYKPAPQRASANANTASAASDGKTSAEPQEQAPICAIHNEPMKRRTGRGGQSFWSCDKKLQDNSWCPYRPPKS